MTFGSLFAGIGGFDLGLERAGMECRWQVEIDEYCRRVLEKHWPNIPKFGDIRELRGDELEPVDLICGGFPCQDISRTGKLEGITGERSGLWSNFFNVVCRLRPRIILVENTPGLLDGPLGTVLGDLASIGYDTEWHCLSACTFGAPHTRERVFIVAHPEGQSGRPGLRRYRDAGPYCESSDCSRCIGIGPVDEITGRFIECPNCGEEWCNWHGRHRADCPGELDELWERDGPECPLWWSAEPGMGRVAYGIPHRMERTTALGNAVVPQVAEWIGRRIIEADEAMKETF